MTPEAGERYAGLDRVRGAQSGRRRPGRAGPAGKDVEDHPHRVPTCERCHTTIEPLLSDQWFMKMAGTPIVDKAIAVAEDGTVKFVPERYQKDLSRLDGRHPRLGLVPPVVVGPSHPHLLQARRHPCRRPQLGTKRSHGRARTSLTQDEDVLDTWFSIALWPFATMGWPATDARFGLLLPHRHADDGARNSAPLGGPHDHDRRGVYRARSRSTMSISMRPCWTKKAAACPNPWATASTLSR